jgi:circadian clock protein KaiC
VTLALGPSGIGKTSLGINFLAASTPEEPGLHFGFYETPQRLSMKAHALGFDFSSMLDSGALSGLHECEITDDGIVIYPRLEALYSHPSRADQADMTRVTSGMAALDGLIGGGLARSSVTLALGPSGIGKTSLGINFLAASTPEEPGLHFGFYETPQRLSMKAHALGFDFSSMLDSGALHVAWQPTTEGLLDGLGAHLLRLVDEKNIKRVLIDSLGGMTRVANNPVRLTEFFSALMGELRARGVTVFATWEVRGLFGPEITSPVPDLSSVVDNILLMRFVELESELKRMLTILKVRDSIYDSSLLEMVIKDKGIDLRKAFKNAESVLSGTATTTTIR